MSVLRDNTNFFNRSYNVFITILLLIVIKYINILFLLNTNKKKKNVYL